MAYKTRLVLETTFNTRELGGIPINKNNQVKWGKLLRSDDISKLSEQDIEDLYEYGIDTIIDLRTKAERLETGYVLAEDERFKKHYISLMTSEDVQDISHSDTDMTLGHFYCQLLDEGQSMIRDIFTILSQKNNEGILFHCAAGKDRTGVIAALILNLLGVSNSDIIANYEVTYSFLSKNPNFQVPIEYQHLVNSDRKHMVLFLEKLGNDYGNVEQYLEICGVSEFEREQIKRAFSEVTND